MLNKICFDYGNLEDFDLTNLLTSILNKVFMMGIVFLFGARPNMFTGLLLALTMIFNHFHFKIKFLPDQKKDLFFKKNFDRKLYCFFSEKIYFTIMLVLSVLYFFYSQIVNNIFDINERSFEGRIKQWAIHQNTLQDRYLILHGYADFYCKMVFILICHVMFKINKNHQLYFDFYKIKILSVFTRAFKYFVLATIFCIFVYRKIFNQTSYLSIAENIIIVYFFIDFFFKFKSGSLQSLHKYIRLLKYITIANILVIIASIYYRQLFFYRDKPSQAIRNTIFRMLSQEVYVIVNFHEDQLQLYSLLIQYLCFNFFNFCSKFENHMKNKPENKYHELFNKPYKFKFIKDFPKKMIQILEVQENYEQLVMNNMDLNFKFYKELKQIYFFKKTHEIHLRKISMKQKTSRSFRLFHFVNKYLTIFNLYQYQIQLQLLNIFMIIIFFTEILNFNVFSILYFALVLVITTQPQFQKLWNASLIFCLLPNLLLMLLNVFLYTTKIFNNDKFQVYNQKVNNFFENQDLSIVLRNNSIIFIMNSIFIYCNYFIWKKTHKNIQKTVIQNLKNKKLTVVEADEDLLYLVKSFFQLGIFCFKLFLLYNLIMRCLYNVNLINFATLLVLLFYVLHQGKKSMAFLLHFLLFTTALKYFSHFDFFFPKLDNQFFIIYGLSFRSKIYQKKFDFESHFSEEYIGFFGEVAIIYCFFLIYNLSQSLSSEKFIETKVFKTKRISSIYNYLVELFVHIKFAIDSTKIYFVYFTNFFFLILQSKNPVNSGEFVFTLCMLLFHVKLYRNQGNLKNKLFYVLFIFYFLVLIGSFIFFYYIRFHMYFHQIQIKTFVREAISLSQLQRDNMGYLIPLVVKLILTIISLKSIRDQIYQDREQEAIEKTLDQKVYFQIFQIISIFIKELTLFYTMYVFLQNLNLFGFAYLISYLIYFTKQIQSLLIVIEQFRLIEIIQFKIKHFKLYLMDKEKTIEQKFLFDSKFIQFNKLYYIHFRKAIFNSIYKNVNGNWTLNFCIILSYFTCLFYHSYYAPIDAISENLLQSLFFNFHKRSQEIINENYFKILYVLIVTVFEVYFIKILKYETSEKIHEDQLKINEVVYLKFKIQAYILEGGNQRQSVFKDDLQNMKYLLDNLTYSNLIDFNYQQERKTCFENNKIFQLNLAQELDEINKTLLLSQNRAKLSFLECISALIDLTFTMIFLPIVFGILQIQSIFMLFFGFIFMALLLLKKNLISRINALNNLMMSFCIIEYSVNISFSFLPDFWQSFDDYQEILHNTSQQITQAQYGGSQLNSLFSLLCYAALFKLFFILLVVISKLVIVKIDETSQEFLESVRHPVVQNKTFFIVDYKMWVKSYYFIYYKIKNFVIHNLANFMFIASVLFYLSSLGTLEMLACLFSVSFKIYLTLFQNESFTNRIQTNYHFYYSILFYINLVIFFLTLIPSWNLCFDGRPLLSNLALSFILLLSLKLRQMEYRVIMKQQFQKISQYYTIREMLLLYSHVYKFNEQNLIKNIKFYKIKQIFDEQYQNDTKEHRKEKKEEFEVFIEKEEYEKKLFSHLGFLKSQILKAKIFFRRNLFSYAVSDNFLSLVFDFLQNNNFTAEEHIDLDIYKFQNFEFKDIRKLISKVPQLQRKNNEMSQTLIENLKKNIDLSDQQINISALIYSQEEQQLNGAIIASNHLQKKLLFEDQSHGILNSPPGRFFEDLYKYQISPTEFMIIKNFDQYNHSIKDYKFLNFSFGQYQSALIQLFYQNLEFIINLTLIFIFCFTSGFLATVMIFHLIFNLLMEDIVNNVKAWKWNYFFFILFLTIQTIVSYKYTLQTRDKVTSLFSGKIVPSYRLVSFISFFYGKIENFMILIVFVLHDTVQTKVCGQSLKNLSLGQIENPTQAFMRIASINGWQRFYNKNNNMIISDLNLIEEQVKQRYKKILSEKDFMIFMIKLIKEKIFIYKQQKEKLQEFRRVVSKLSLQYHNDRHGQCSKYYKSFFWRNFNFLLRKPGINMHTFLVSYLCMMLCFFVTFFYKLLGVNESVLQKILQNDIQKTLGINASMFFLFICLDRYFYSKFNYRWISNVFSEKDVVESVLQNTQKKEYQMQKYRLKNIVKKYIIIQRISKRNHIKRKNYFKNNPLIKKFFLIIFFWFYLTFLCFFWLPISGHSKKMTETKQIVLFCNDFYMSLQDEKVFSGECNNFTNNVYLQVFYILGNIYVIIALWQIKVGFSLFNFFQKSRHTILSTKDKMSFYFYKYTPFLREITTVIDFIASHTSLNIFQWFKQNDIETSILEARVIEQSNVKQGKKIGRLYKRITGFFFLLFFFFILMFPLFVFSDFFPSSITNDITGAQFVVEAVIENNTFQIYKNKALNISQITETSIDFRKLKNNEMYKKYAKELVWKVVFNKQSDSYFYITKESTELIQNVFRRKTDVTINIEITLNTKLKGDIKKTFPLKLTEENAIRLVDIMNLQSCQTQGNTRVFLSEQSKLIDIKRVNKPGESISADFNFVYMLKYNCNEQKDKFYFELSNDKFEEIYFIIINEQIKNQVEFFQKYSKKRISITSIYIIIFSYIGISFIRKAFFEQANRFWITESPNAHLLQDTANLIVYSRLKGNMFKEERFYHRLVDLFRSPEKIKKITGNISNK